MIGPVAEVKRYWMQDARFWILDLGRSVSGIPIPASSIQHPEQHGVMTYLTAYLLAVSLRAKCKKVYDRIPPPGAPSSLSATFPPGAASARDGGARGGMLH